MDIFEQYFDKQLEYTYYKYRDEIWYKKGIDSLALNKDLMPYYLFEILEDEPDDWFYFPVLDNQGNRHRFLDSQSDFLFYFMKHTTELFSAEPSAIRAKIIELWQTEGAKYYKMPLTELANKMHYLALPKEEFNGLVTEHEMSPAVTHLLKNYGNLTDLD